MRTHLGDRLHRSTSALAAAGIDIAAIERHSGPLCRLKLGVGTVFQD
jgi:hypothetical protein